MNPALANVPDGCIRRTEAAPRHCLSREAFDIVCILVNDLFGQALIYRDHIQGCVLQVLPWLLSTEVCKHFFAEMRKLVDDITYLNFLHMVPALQLLVCDTKDGPSVLDACSQAAGYAHT